MEVSTGQINNLSSTETAFMHRGKHMCLIQLDVVSKSSDEAISPHAQSAMNALYEDSFINMRHEDWWFNLHSTKDKIEMTFFVLRYISGLFIFILGLKAPGIMQPQYDDDVDHLVDENSENRSTWVNAWTKLSTLAPFIWPRNDMVLQLKVIFAFVLLIGGRVINLYVPIYNKKIVDSLTTTEFRWDWVLLYVGFKFLQGGGTGGMGLLNNLRSFLWIKISQFTTREIGSIIDIRIVDNIVNFVTISTNIVNSTNVNCDDDPKLELVACFFDFMTPPLNYPNTLAQHTHCPGQSCSPICPEYNLKRFSITVLICGQIPKCRFFGLSEQCATFSA